MNDHTHFAELTALAAGGYLNDEESRELREHLATCAECRLSAREFCDLVHFGLPMTRGEFWHLLDEKKVQPGLGVRERFRLRARREGIMFSPQAETSGSPGWRFFSYQMAGAALVIIGLLVAGIYVSHTVRRSVMVERAQSQQQILRLTDDKARLSSRLAESDRRLSELERETERLHAEARNTARVTEGYRLSNEQQGVRLEKSISRNAQVLGELLNREQQLAESRDEVARINQLRAMDQATLATRQARLDEISDQLRIANATLDMERQLNTAGRDIRQLMMARQLHVIDVRDTETNGKPSEAFGRIFLTEGKSLVFYAFDLNQGDTSNTNERFEVWGEQLAKKSPQILGLLHLESRTQRRWTLRIDDPHLVSEIDSVFITVSAADKTRPSGQRLLYAYLGQPRNP